MVSETRPLLLDCGNSSCKYRYGDQSGRLTSLEQVLDCVQRLAPTETVLASVSGLGAEVAAELQARGLPVLVLKVVDGQNGLRLAYRHTENLGVDRWLAMLALPQPGRPLAAIDAGTALTLDLLDGAGRHLGGYILPGLGLMRRTLVDDTFALPPVTTPGTLDAGRDTVDCIANGSVLALVGALETALKRYGVADGDVYWTGGDAAALRTLSAWPGRHHPQLIFEGMMSLIADPDYRALLA